MHHRIWLAGVAVLVLAPSGAWAQSARTIELMRQLRASQFADLLAERARIEAQLAAIATALPPQPVAAPPAAAAAPAKVDPAAPVAVAAAPPAPIAPGVPAKPADGAPAGAEMANTKGATAEKTDGTKFGGLDLGAGLSFTVDVGRLDRISRASVVNGIVRTDDQDNGRARLMFESHYFFTPCSGGLFGLVNPCKDRLADPTTARWGVGPFIAIQPGSNEVIDAIGMGLMIGARRELSAQSFNLGIGIVFDPNTRVLGDGIVANRPLPMGETEVRYRETLQTGVLILTSFSF